MKKDESWKYSKNNFWFKKVEGCKIRILIRNEFLIIAFTECNDLSKILCREYKPKYFNTNQIEDAKNYIDCYLSRIRKLKIFL